MAFKATKKWTKIEVYRQRGVSITRSSFDRSKRKGVGDQWPRIKKKDERIGMVHKRLAVMFDGMKTKRRIMMAINITVRAESRSARAAKAYNDQIKHKYNLNYVNPQTRRILVRATGIPGNAVSFEWRVTRRKDGKLFRKSGQLKNPGPDLSDGFNLPSEGIYDCQLIVTLHGGQQQESPVKSINLRDLLIVVIGDSAASGQGNPDKPGKLNFPKKIEDLADIPEFFFDAFKDFLSELAVEQMTSLFASALVPY